MSTEQKTFGTPDQASEGHEKPGETPLSEIEDPEERSLERLKRNVVLLTS